MKKLILVFAAIAITATAYSQADSASRKMSPPDINNTNDDMNQNRGMNNDQNQNMRKDRDGKSYPDGLMMQDGKMMRVQNGQMTNLDDEMTLANGTKIKRDGTCIDKDGSKRRMKEGQHMDMSGNIVPMKTDKDKNMYLVPDSTQKKVN